MVEGVAAGLDPKPAIISLNPFSIQEVVADALMVGQAVGMEKEAQAAVDKLNGRIKKAQDLAAELGPAKYKSVSLKTHKG